MGFKVKQRGSSKDDPCGVIVTDITDDADIPRQIKGMIIDEINGVSVLQETIKMVRLVLTIDTAFRPSHPDPCR